MTDQEYPQQPYVWPADLPLEPDHTAELPVTPAVSFWGDPDAELGDKPRHEKPRNRRRIVPGVPWFLAAAAVVVAYVSAVDPFGEASMTFPSPTAQPAPKPRPAVTKTVRVTAPALPAETETKYVQAPAPPAPKAKPAPTVTIVVTKNVPTPAPASELDPAPEDVTP